MSLDFHHGALRPGKQERTSYSLMHNWLLLDKPKRNSFNVFGNCEEQHKSETEVSIKPKSDQQKVKKEVTETDFLQSEAKNDYEFLARDHVSYQKLPIYPSARGHDQNPPVHLQYGEKSCGYDDYHRAFLKLSMDNGPPKNKFNTFPHYGPPRLRNGNGGSSWRHVKYTLEPRGSRHLFVDGQVCLNDKYIARNTEKGNLLLPEIENSKENYLENLFLPRKLKSFDKNKNLLHNRESAKRARECNNWWVMR